jgi:hypothetical protein
MSVKTKGGNSLLFIYLISNSSRFIKELYKAISTLKFCNTKRHFSLSVLCWCGRLLLCNFLAISLYLRYIGLIVQSLKGTFTCRVFRP